MIIYLCDLCICLLKGVSCDVIGDDYLEIMRCMFYDVVLLNNDRFVIRGRFCFFMGLKVYFF